MKNSYLYSSICPFLFIIAFVTLGSGQTNVDKIDKLISTYADYGQFNGSVLVAEKGKVIYKKGFGLANMEWNIPNQVDTKHRLASVSKQFTAMLTMQLVAENKLELNEPISTYLPDYPKENGDIITLHHLLTHTSGIPNYTSFSGYREMMRDFISPEGIVKIFADSTLKFTPGERFSYSNSGYALLGVIIEKTTGKSFEEVLKEKILQPLKMNNTGYDNHRTVLKNRAAGYNKSGRNFTNASHIDMSVGYTAGGIYSTVEDMYLWDQALYTEKLLPKKYLDMM
ncbi:MAG: CubicO group peptidase (beta-lactamase class C family), partial [Maribacter sp.]